MKFLALVKKEFRECLPWVCLAFILFTGLGGLHLRFKVRYEEMNRKAIWAEKEVQTWCWSMSPVSDIGPLLLITALGLGLVIAIRQFYVPGFDKTWAFTLHRPVKPSTIVHAKLLATILGMTLSMGLPWTGMYLFSAAPGRFMLPVLARIFWEGWHMIGLGFVLYLGTAVSSLSQAQWYTTKVFGLAFAAGLIFLAMAEAPYPAPLMYLGTGLVVLGVQVYSLMQSKEF